MPPDAIRPGMEHFVERQLQQWRASRAKESQLPPVARELRDCICISNAVGAGGGEIAYGLAERLGWPVFDRNLLHAMAGNDEWRARVYSTMDERAMSLFEQTLRFLLDHSFVKNDYFRRLTRTVLFLARQQEAIFLGRFVDLILPLELGLRVKITASLGQCAATFAEATGTDLRQAAVEVERIEQERADFIARHFPDARVGRGRFDLEINSERFTTEQAIELVLVAMPCRSRSVRARAAQAV